KCGNFELRFFSNIGKGFEKLFFIWVQNFFFFFFLIRLSFFSFIFTLIPYGKVHPSMHLLFVEASLWKHLCASGRTLVQTRNPN
ncbi:hypothetical protein, partial [Mycobacterium tuberculosis]|uniref:hypothetical protein n=1 Tax=Mycobacterium tuberculosis TaxID=1773 RepID=UPI00254CF129